MPWPRKTPETARFTAFPEIHELLRSRRVSTSSGTTPHHTSARRAGLAFRSRKRESFTDIETEW
jgi:hypothetical protein